MPDDSDERLEQIKRDLVYYTTAHANQGVGLPPTVHAAKYADDVGYLVAKLEAKPAAPLEKSQLEIELEHDAAGRTERRKPTR